MNKRITIEYDDEPVAGAGTIDLHTAITTFLNQASIQADVHEDGAYQGEPMPGTIGELLGMLPYYTGTEFQGDLKGEGGELRAMALDTPCGIDCERVLRMGSQLMEHCADVRDDLRASIVRQVEIFYYG